MEIKRKIISKGSWNRIQKKQFCCVDIKENKNGVAGLLFLEKVNEPLVRHCFGKDITLADDGYYWLQIAFSGDNYWLTALYDDKKNFLQYYFDISINNTICGENSYFDDLFLDVIVQGKGEHQILDKDELDRALKLGIISKDQHKMALFQATQIIDNAEKNRDKIDEVCGKYFDLLLKHMNKK